MKRSRSSWAFSLVEVTLAMGVASFCLLAVIALVPTGSKVSYGAAQETGATNILAAVVADMRATPASATASTQYAIRFAAGTQTTLYIDRTGGSSSAISNNSIYRVVVTSNGGSGATFMNLKATWPAAALPENAAGSSQIFAAITRN